MTKDKVYTNLQNIQISCLILFSHFFISYLSFCYYVLMVIFNDLLSIFLRSISQLQNSKNHPTLVCTPSIVLVSVCPPSHNSLLTGTQIKTNLLKEQEEKLLIKFNLCVPLKTVLIKECRRGWEVAIKVCRRGREVAIFR